MKLYLAGPMKSYPFFNFPMFDAVANALRNQGHTIINPADHDRMAYPSITQWPGYLTGNTDICPEFDLYDAMRWDLTQVLQCDGIVMLPKWEMSSGARTERFTAERTGRRVFLCVLDEHCENPILVETTPDLMAIPSVKEAA